LVTYASRHERDLCLKTETKKRRMPGRLRQVCSSARFHQESCCEFAELPSTAGHCPRGASAGTDHRADAGTTWILGLVRFFARYCWWWSALKLEIPQNPRRYITAGMRSVGFSSDV